MGLSYIGKQTTQTVEIWNKKYLNNIEKSDSNGKKKGGIDINRSWIWNQTNKANSVLVLGWIS